MGAERTETLYRVWRRVNEIACSTEDSATIRGLIAEAGIEPGVHVGRPPEEFTDEITAEWVLGQWADMIDAGSPFLNSGRNVSLFHYERIFGKTDWPEADGGNAWHPAEVSGIVERLGRRADVTTEETDDRAE
jgi:hypothetical protein